MCAKRFLMCLAVIIGLSVAWVIIPGCSPSRTVTTSTDPSITIPVEHSYPQMYTKDMLDIKDDVEQEFNVTFLGCYDDTQGAFLFWVWDNAKGVCEANVISESQFLPIGCEDAWDLYNTVCHGVGNCV
jgi:hypothetical protein